VYKNKADDMQYDGQILLADDDPDYAILVQEALHQAGLFNHIEIVHNGLEAVEYLKGEAANPPDSHPQARTALAILDLRLPVKHGFDVLRWIRRQPEFQNLPVVMLSGSGFEAEERTAYELGATAYEVKPAQFQQLLNLVERLRDRFLMANTNFAGSNA
jgi:CheY-like chemotaxis protein